MLLGLWLGQIDDHILCLHSRRNFCSTPISEHLGIPGSLCCVVSAYLANTEVSLAKTSKTYLIFANGSHFKKHFSINLAAMGVKQMTAPINHPSSVGLAERYVQVILNCYRAVLQHHPEGIMKWDSYLKGIVNSINTKMIRVYGFNPAQFLFGFSKKPSMSKYIVYTNREPYSQPAHAK